MAMADDGKRPSALDVLFDLLLGREDGEEVRRRGQQILLHSSSRDPAVIKRVADDGKRL